MKMPLDKVIEKVVALGVPGLVLVIVIAAVGPVGAAAITTALATLLLNNLIKSLAFFDHAQFTAGTFFDGFLAFFQVFYFS